MKRIYADKVLANVMNLYNVLKLNGIDSLIRNQYFDLGLEGMESCPELWVADKDVKCALKIMHGTASSEENGCLSQISRLRKDWSKDMHD